MSLAALCLSQPISLLISAATAKAGLKWRRPQTDGAVFTAQLTVEQPRFALITQEYLSEAAVFRYVRAESPDTVIILCLTANYPPALTDWAQINELKFDTLCTLAELPNCLQTLLDGRFFASQLLQMLEQSKAAAAIPGLAELSTAERRVLLGVCHSKSGPQLAEQLFIDEKTVNNHKYKIAQKLGATGGPGCLTRFVTQHREALVKWLA